MDCSFTNDSMASSQESHDEREVRIRIHENNLMTEYISSVNSILNSIFRKYPFNDDEKQEIDKIKEILTEINKNYIKRHTQLEDFFTMNKKLCSKIEHYRLQYEELTSYKNACTNLTEQATELMAYKNWCQLLGKDVRDLTDTNISLNQKILEFDSKQNFEEENKTLKEENKTLKELINSILGNENIDSVQTKREFEQTKRELEQTKRELEQTKRELEQTKRELQASQRNVDSEILSAFQQKLEATEKELETFKNLAKEQFDQSKTDYNNLNKENEKLKQFIRNTRSNLNTVVIDGHVEADNYIVADGHDVIDRHVVADGHDVIDRHVVADGHDVADRHVVEKKPDDNFKCPSCGKQFSRSKYHDFVDHCSIGCSSEPS